VGPYVDASGSIRGFLRNEKGVYSSIDIPGARLTVTTGISNSGQIVGRFRDANG
jgi:hypothetical protein